MTKEYGPCLQTLVEEKNNYILPYWSQLTHQHKVENSWIPQGMFNTSRNCAMPLVKCNEVTSFTIMILSKRKIICWFTFSKLRVVQVHSLSQFQDLWWSGYIFGKQCWITHWTYRIWLSSIALFKCQPPLAIEYQVQVPFLNSGDTEETCFYCQFKLTF